MTLRGMSKIIISPGSVRSAYAAFRNDPFLMSSSAVAALMFVLAVACNYFAVAYATLSISSPVTDLILSNIPVFDVDGIYIYGPILLIAFVLYLLLSRPQRFPFAVKSMALFIVIRAVFICLTHLGPFPDHVSVPVTGIFSDFSSLGDLFFSGHTGLPFLLALVFWDSVFLRYLFVTISVFFGIIVLMGHLHYSIDVLSAFFMAYGIYHIAGHLFPKDKTYFKAFEPADVKS